MRINNNVSGYDVTYRVIDKEAVNIDLKIISGFDQRQIIPVFFAYYGHAK
jgi:hypothetical protein